eukprot:1484479-Rhodomonas_salina.1
MEVCMTASPPHLMIVLSTPPEKFSAAVTYSIGVNMGIAIEQRPFAKGASKAQPQQGVDCAHSQTQRPGHT